MVSRTVCRSRRECAGRAANSIAVLEKNDSFISQPAKCCVCRVRKGGSKAPLGVFPIPSLVAMPCWGQAREGSLHWSQWVYRLDVLDSESRWLYEQVPRPCSYLSPQNLQSILQKG